MPESMWFFFFVLVKCLTTGVLCISLKSPVLSFQMSLKRENWIWNYSICRIQQPSMNVTNSDVKFECKSVPAYILLMVWQGCVRAFVFTLSFCGFQFVFMCLSFESSLVFYLLHSKQLPFCLPQLQISAIRVIPARRRWYQSYLHHTHPLTPTSIFHWSDWKDI